MFFHRVFLLVPHVFIQCNWRFSSIQTVNMRGREGSTNIISSNSKWKNVFLQALCDFHFVAYCIEKQWCQNDSAHSRWIEIETEKKKKKTSSRSMTETDYVIRTLRNRWLSFVRSARSTTNLIEVPTCYSLTIKVGAEQSCRLEPIDHECLLSLPLYLCSRMIIKLGGRPITSS